MAIDSDSPLTPSSELTLEDADPAVSAGEGAHADPMTGEPGAHPAAVGIGAIAAGAAGAAAIGAFAGPIGAVIGAAIGAVAGGLAGHEVAVARDEPAASPVEDLEADTSHSAMEGSGLPSPVEPVSEENIAVFPGLDLGSPAVTTQDTAAVGEEQVSGGSGEAEGFTVGDEAARPFASGADPAEAVRVAAYYRYIHRLEDGRPIDAVADWYEAEREVHSF